MKFGQFVEYNLRNIFLEKSYTDCGGETIPRSFFKKSKLSISLDQYSKVLNILLLLLGNSRTIKIDWNLAADHLHLPQIKRFFKKTKRRLELVCLPHFLHGFWSKNISLVIFFYLTKLQYLVAFTSWDIGRYVYCNSLLTRLWRNKFWD